MLYLITVAAYMTLDQAKLYTFGYMELTTLAEDLLAYQALHLPEFGFSSA